MPIKTKPPADDLGLLLALGEKVGDYTVKPWTLKQFAEVLPVVQSMLNKLQAQGLTWDNLETWLINQGLTALPEIAPEIPALLAVSLRQPLPEMEELDWLTGAALTLAIFRVNLDLLKNFLGPQLLGALKSLES